MKGLLLKDLSYLKVSRILVIVLTMTVLFSFATDNSFAMSFLAVMSASMVQTTFSYDDFQGGTRFLLTLPVTRRLYVASKYVLALIVSFGCIGVAFVLSLAGGLLRGEGVDLAALAVSGVVGWTVACVMSSLSIPVMLRFGLEKGRFVSMGLYMVAALALFAGSELFKGTATALSQMSAPVLLLLGAALAALLVGGSLTISQRIVQKKDY